jgi:large subunit ribosomal protein L24
MAKMKLKKDDQVLVIAGKDKGKTGQVLKVKTDVNRVIVAGVNMAKKAVKPNQQTGEQGGFKEAEASIHASNVMLLDPKTGKGSRKRAPKA